MTMTKQRGRAAGLYTITISQFALAFMLSAVAVAVPALGQEFGANAAQLGLVESGYIAAVAALLFPIARFSDMIGRRSTFGLGIATFTAMSFILPLATNMNQFIALRVLQGAGGAMMVSTGLAIIADIYPGAGRSKALGIATAGIYLGLSAGPWIGGIITTHFGWRGIFYVGATPCALGLLLSLKTLSIKPVITRGIRFDWPGALLGGVGMIMLAMGGSHMNDPSGKFMMAGSILSLISFVFWEKRAKAPLLDMTMFSANRPFAYSSAVQFISYAATFGITFLISLYLQITQGMSASQAGLILLAQPIMQVIFSLLSGGWCERWPLQRIATLGMGTATIAMGGAIFLGSEASILLTITVLGLCGAGTAIFATANMSMIMGAVQQKHYGVAAAVVASMRTTGMAVSLVLISTVFAMIIGPVKLDANSAEAFITAMQISFAILTLLSVLGVFMCIRAATKRSATSEYPTVIPDSGKVILQPAAMPIKNKIERK